MTETGVTMRRGAVTVVTGDVAVVEADGVVVPHFRGAASFAGVGGAVARSGASRGMRAYQELVEDACPPPPFGAVVATRSGGGTCWWLLHATTVGAGRDHDADVVRTAVRMALRVARAKGITSLSVPLLGTGAAGHLTPEGSLRAVLAGVADHAAAGGAPVPLRVVVPWGVAGSRDAVTDEGTAAAEVPDDGELLAAMAAHQAVADATSLPEADGDD